MLHTLWLGITASSGGNPADLDENKREELNMYQKTFRGRRAGGWVRRAACAFNDGDYLIISDGVVLDLTVRNHLVLSNPGGVIARLRLSDAGVRKMEKLQAECEAKMANERELNNDL